MQVTSTIKMDFGRIEKLTKAAVTALEHTAEAVHNDVANAQVIPMKSGALSGEQYFVDNSESSNGKVTLIHNTPYARRMYYHPEYHFNKEFHANARGNWYQPWLDGNRKNFAKDTFKRFYRKDGDL